MSDFGTGTQAIAGQSILVELGRLRALVASGTCTCELLVAIDQRVLEIRQQLGLSQGGGEALGPTNDGGDD